MPYNIGCAGGWNMIMKSYMNAPYWVIINHDCSFGSGFLKEMYEAAQDEETGLVFGNGGDFGLGSFDLFLIKDWVIQSHGYFDENLYPCYGEDSDYIMRLHIKPVKTVLNLESKYFHGDDLLMEVDPKFYRPAEIDLLLGDSTRARNELGWKPKSTFIDLVRKMVDNDLKIVNSC